MTTSQNAGQEPATLFRGSDGRVRPIWRAVLYVPIGGLAAVLAAFGTFLVIAVLDPELARVIQSGALPPPRGGIPLYAVMNVALLLAAWLLLRAFDRRSFRNLGLWFYGRWGRELLLGIALGFGLVGLVTVILMAPGWVKYAGASWDGRVFASLAAYGLLLFLAAAFEEILFRGYAFQRLVDSIGPLGAILVLAALFGAAHIGNPSSTPLAVANTILAGVLLAVAYLKTKALWLPIGLHWAWNFCMGPVLGLPVSGLTFGAPLLRAEVSGREWQSGGSYGPEGSAVLTVAAVVAIVWLSRTQRISASSAMKEVLQ